MKSCIRLFGILLICTPMLCFGVASSTWTGWLKITGYGCHMRPNGVGEYEMCWFEVSGAALGPEGCRGKVLGFLPSRSVNGDRTYNSLVQAFLAGREVQFAVEDACLPQARYPTFSEFKVH